MNALDLAIHKRTKNYLTLGLFALLFSTMAPTLSPFDSLGIAQAAPKPSPFCKKGPLSPQKAQKNPILRPQKDPCKKCGSPKAILRFIKNLRFSTPTSSQLPPRPVISPPETSESSEPSSSWSSEFSGFTHNPSTQNPSPDGFPPLESPFHSVKNASHPSKEDPSHSQPPTLDFGETSLSLNSANSATGDEQSNVREWLQENGVFVSPVELDIQSHPLVPSAFGPQKKPRPTIITENQFHQMLNLAEQIRNLQWDIEPKQFLDLYLHISSFQQEWTQQAKKLQRPIHLAIDCTDSPFIGYAPIEPDRAHLPQSTASFSGLAQIVALPDGSLLIDHANTRLGKGGFKAADRQMQLTSGPDGLMQLHPFVALHARTDKMLDRQGVFSPKKAQEQYAMLKAEYQTYHAIAEGLKQHPEMTGQGLATAEFIDLGDHRSFIKQKQYTGSLKTSRWKPPETQAEKQAILQKLYQLSQGLQQLHQLGLIHSDIKEDNVLVDESGNADLTDFGLTYDLQTSSHQGGTYSYFAPEKILALGLDQRTPLKAIPETQDIFAFGLLALHTVKGFEEASLARNCEWMYATLRDNGMTQACFAEKVPEFSAIFFRKVQKMAQIACQEQDPDFCKEQIIADCLHPDPSYRPSARQLEHRLHGALLRSLSVD
jgi:hypothetical protein